MDWAHRKMLMIWLVLGGVLLAFLIILGFSIFYKTPTCFDMKQNGSETGVDCGGSCSTVCSVAAQPASVRFARALTQSGRTDLIAYIDNANKDAYAKDARVTVTVYRQDGHTLEKHATLTLPANSSTPLFIPSIAGGSVQQVFVSFDQGYPQWTKGTGLSAPQPKASNVSIQPVGAGERITAIITNQTAYVANDVPLVATVFGEDGSVIAASQTVIPALPAQGIAEAIFTWNEPFAATPARVEVVPLLSLPRLVP